MGEVAMRVGNDVIDLASPRYGRAAGKSRLLKRVMDPREARAIQAAPRPELALWFHWAGKETAFKVVSKLLGSPPPFRHARFVVSLGTSPSELEPPRAIVGYARYDDIGVELRYRHTGDVLHCVGWSGPVGSADDGAPASLPRLPADSRDEWGGPPIPTPAGAVHCGVVSLDVACERLELPDLAGVGGAGAGAPSSRPKRGKPPPRSTGGALRASLAGRLSEEELRSVHSPPSALARLVARASCALRLGVAEEEVEIVTGGAAPGRGFPIVLVSGRPAAVDLSLSHDGRFVAWAISGG